MGGTLVEDLCMWREVAQRHQERRTRRAVQVKQLRPVQDDGGSAAAQASLRGG